MNLHSLKTILILFQNHLVTSSYLFINCGKFFVRQAAPPLPLFNGFYRNSSLFIVLFFAMAPSCLRDGTDVRVLYIFMIEN